MRSEGMAKEMPAATLSVLMPMTSPSWRGDRSSGHCARLAVAPLPEALWAAEAPPPALPAQGRSGLASGAPPRPAHCIPPPESPPSLERARWPRAPPGGALRGGRGTVRIRRLAGRGRVGPGQLTVSLTLSSLPGSARPWGPHIPGEAPGTSAPPIAGVTSQQSHKGTEPWIEARFICLVLWAHVPAWSSGALEVGRSRGSPRVSHQPCLPSRRVSRAAENQRPHSGGHLPGSPVVPRSSRTAGREGNVTLAVPRLPRAAQRRVAMSHAPAAPKGLVTTPCHR